MNQHQVDKAKKEQTEVIVNADAAEPLVGTIASQSLSTSVCQIRITRPRGAYGVNDVVDAYPYELSEYRWAASLPAE